MNTLMNTKLTGLTAAAADFGMPVVLGASYGTPMTTGGFGSTGLVGAVRIERPLSASEAVVGLNAGLQHAADAGDQNEQQHPKWAFRGPGPWRERN